MGDEAMDNIMVCVRCRPFNAREVELGCECIVQMPFEELLLE